MTTTQRCFLAACDTVSIPLLQQRFSLNYRSAAAMMRRLRECLAVANEPIGIAYQVNRRYFRQRALEMEEGRALCEELTYHALTLLSNIAAEPKAASMGLNDEEEYLLRQGLLYRFDGFYLSAVTVESVKAVQQTLRRELLEAQQAQRRRSGDDDEENPLVRRFASLSARAKKDQAPSGDDN